MTNPSGTEYADHATKILNAALEYVNWHPAYTREPLRDACVTWLSIALAPTADGFPSTLAVRGAEANQIMFGDGPLGRNARTGYLAHNALEHAVQITLKI